MIATRQKNCTKPPAYG